MARSYKVTLTLAEPLVKALGSLPDLDDHRVHLTESLGTLLTEREATALTEVLVRLQQAIQQQEAT